MEHQGTPLAEAEEKICLNVYSEALKDNTRPVIWMHSSSLGEFEQGRFLIENIRDGLSIIMYRHYLLFAFRF